MENARLLEIFIERKREQSIAGGIYKGCVTRVLPGMQAAFVDIGLPKAAFLHASDLYRPDAPSFDEADVEVDLQSGDGGEANAAKGVASAPIEEQLTKGHTVIVQIAKEPIGTKGARITTSIAIPGRYVVYLPLARHVGVSRRIASEAERERLKQAVESAGSGGGAIVRTACEGVAKRDIQADLRLLRKLWSSILQRAESAPAPALLHRDLDVILRAIRDLAADVSRVVIDNRQDHQRVVEFVEAVMPRWRPRIELYERKEPIFERYGIESQISKALERKVWLKSGGYLIFDETEALTTIDVNTGRYVGNNDQHETMLRTNLEAAQAIVNQLRLRDIGGLIIIDFIDMERAEHRKAVLAALTDALRSDKAHTKILGISELGLVEMTRKRVRQSLSRRLCEPCPACSGQGWVKGIATTTYEVLRRIRREATMNAPVKRVSATVHPRVAEFLRQQEPDAVRGLQQELGVSIGLRESTHLSPEQYEVIVSAAPTTRAVAESTEKTPPATAERAQAG